MAQKYASPCIASLHVHPAERNQKKAPTKMIAEPHMDLVQGKGIVQDVRYFDTKNKSSGKANKNHVSLMTREEIASFKCDLLPGDVRSNIELNGSILSGEVTLADLIHKNVRIGQDAVLHIYKLRTPCWQMDVLQPGLQASMRHGRQGVIAEVVHSGRISIGDTISIVE